MAEIQPIEAQVRVDVDKRALASLVPEGRKRFDKQGYLALEPKAFFELFFIEPAPQNERVGDTEIVTVRGPLEFHSSWFDSYDGILSRVAEACATDAKNVVLRIDSPGGDALGCFSTAQAIREKCATAGKRVWTHIEGMGCSAAYALACAGEYICADASAIVGSVGVISTRVDLTGLDAAMGVKVHVITSGSRKADGHPSLPMSDEEFAATQEMINSLAGAFADLVAESRGMKAEDVLALEAGIFTGADAVTKGLVDSAQSLESMLADLAGGQEQPRGASMATKYEEGRAALEEAAKGDDEEAKKAQRALKAMDSPEEEEEPEAAADGKDKDEMPFDPAKGDEEEDKKEKASASAAVRAFFARTEGSIRDKCAAFALALDPAAAVPVPVPAPTSKEAAKLELEVSDLKAKVAELTASAEKARDEAISDHIDRRCRATRRVNAQGEPNITAAARDRVFKAAKADGDNWRAAIDELLDGGPPAPPAPGVITEPNAKTPKGGAPDQEQTLASVRAELAKANPTWSPKQVRAAAAEEAPKRFPELFKRPANA